MNIVVLVFAQLCHIQKFFQALLALFFRNFLFFHRVHDILPDLEPWKQGIVLKHKRTVRTWFGNFLAIDHDLSFIRRLEPSNNGQCCGFAAAGRTQKGYKLPFRNVKGNILQDQFSFLCIAPVFKTFGNILY